jgi:hypothetical protein
LGDRQLISEIRIGWKNFGRSIRESSWEREGRLEENELIRRMTRYLTKLNGELQDQPEARDGLVGLNRFVMVMFDKDGKCLFNKKR